MARYIFGGEMPQGFASPDTTNMGTEATPRAALAQVPANTTVPLFLLNGAAVTDFLLWNSATSAYDIASTTVTVNSTGTFGTPGRGFQGPDGVTELFDGNGNVILARDRVTGSGTTLTSYATQVATLSDYPLTFPATTHSHDDRYYTEAEADARFALVTASIPVEMLTWSFPGSLAVTADDVVPIYNDHTSPRTIVAMRIQVGTSPGTSAVIVDLNLDGTTVFTTQTNRPTIAVGQLTSGKVTSMNVTAWPAGSALAPNIDQIGSSTAPGADMIIQLLVR